MLTPESGTRALQALTSVCLLPSYLFICLTNVFGAPASAPGSSVSTGDTRANKTQVPGDPGGLSMGLQPQCRRPAPSLGRATGMAHAYSQGTEAIMHEIHERLEKMVHNKN